MKGLYASITPVVRCGKRLELVIDEKLSRPIIVISGKNADDMCRVLSKKFTTRHSGKEILIPLHALPSINVWILASYRVKPSEELLDKLLLFTPRLLADLFWDLVDISSNTEAENDKPLINQHVLSKASKIVRELLKLYKVN